MAKFYITTPLYYVNSSPHIGHSYTNIACDAIARYRRLKGDEVLFTTGTDEHGQKINQAAELAGKDPARFVDEIVPVFVRLWDKLNISYDDFIRTTERRHIKVVQQVLEMFYKNGDLYEGEYKGWYCTPCENFWLESQLVEGNCPDCGRKVEFIKEKNFFFRLSRYQDWLVDYIKTHDNFILPIIRRNEVLAFLENPLNDLCISRPRSRLSWGIDIPFSKDHVTYVWFDALLNYITVCGYGEDDERFRRFWPADLHVIGKDILRMHAVNWPIILHAAGLEPPVSIFAHGWWKIGGDKMSKSKGNIVDPSEMVDRYGVDAYRYFLLREIQFGMDGSFSEELLVSRINSDLANDLGNLLHRTLTMIEKYFSGTVPERTEREKMDDISRGLMEKSDGLYKVLDSSMNRIDFSQALSAIWDLVNSANKFIEQKAPWNLSRDKKIDELKDMMYDLYEVLRIISISLWPFLPTTAEGILAQLGLGKEEIDIKRLSWGIGRPGRRIKKGSPLFPRVTMPKNPEGRHCPKRDNI